MKRRRKREHHYYTVGRYDSTYVTHLPRLHMHLVTLAIVYEFLQTLGVHSI
jgi:hypothetical protein